MLNSSKGSEPINTRQELADQASVSSDSYAKWEYVQEHGDQQTKDRLARKEISLHRAYKETIPGVKRAKKAADLNARTTTARRVDHPDGWHLGDWRDHVDALEDESVSLVLTDPPYGIGFQSDHRADRSKPRKHQKITNDDPAQAMAEIGAAMAALLPKLKPDAHLYCFCHWRTEPQVREVLEAAGLKLRGSLIWVKNNTGMGDTLTTHAPLHERILHLVKGSPVLIDRDPDVFHFDRVNSNRHPTEKPVDLLKRLIEITTVTGELVADPFGGVASVAVAAKEVGRKSWSVEVDENFYEIGSERLKTSETPNVGDEILTKENIEDGQT